MILTHPTWQIKHSWRVNPSRQEILKVLEELKIILAKSVPADLASKVYLVSDELLRNSLEHGCFKIGKDRKAQMLKLGTFEEFLDSAERNLKNDSKNWIEFEIAADDKVLTLTVRDSGDGYQLEAKKEKSPDLTRLSNRGLEIIQGLSSNLNIEMNPTQTIVSFNLS